MNWETVSLMVLLESTLAFGLATLGVLIWNWVPSRRRDGTQGRRFGLLALGGLAIFGSAALWFRVSGGEVAVVHWLISLCLAGPLVVFTRAAREWKNETGGVR